MWLSPKCKIVNTESSFDLLWFDFIRWSLFKAVVKFEESGKIDIYKFEERPRQVENNDRKWHC